ncbi:type II toxin-antitoxin system VapC family toxin [Moraxella nasibovis]|uniref:type II toxin-antitoxin system VapC family toxin n=1 Tax=Moraxella nasibovis TaxID=2904120 RepID=UPI002410AE32|nr:type II toxin-antitoxin system VapC family toxin [Moraxella nasibovis]WFF38276.1 type II toxin-antitoxin system VapC family toxin [Moraxella nasibovis]
MILLDTNVISEVRKIEQNKADPNVTHWVKTLDFSKVYLSAIVVGELKFGVLLKRHNKDFVQADVLEDWLNHWVFKKFDGRILPVDEKVAQIYASLNIPNPKSTNDAYIAATAIAHDLTVATRNVKDFDGMPVKLINPFEHFI